MYSILEIETVVIAAELIEIDQNGGETERGRGWETG